MLATDALRNGAMTSAGPTSTAWLADTTSAARLADMPRVSEAGSSRTVSWSEGLGEIVGTGGAVGERLGIAVGGWDVGVAMACTVCVGLGVAVDARGRLSDDEESSDDDEREALDVRGVAVRVGLGGDSDVKDSFVGVEDSADPVPGVELPVVADRLPVCVVGVAVAPSAAAEIGAVPTVPVGRSCVAVAFTAVAVGGAVVAVDFGAVAVACGVAVTRCEVAVGLGAVAVGCAALLPTFADGLVGSGLVSAQIGARTEAANPLLPVPRISPAAVAVGWLKPSDTSKASTAPGRRLIRTQVVPHGTAFPLVTDEAPLRIPHAHMPRCGAPVSRTALKCAAASPIEKGVVD
jgi:hypothetical protein